jgi:ATP-dependent Clp protease ATP-binding subunit ClpC
LSHNYIGTEHLLLGLLREEEGVAARVLEGLGVTLEETRALVRSIVGEGDQLTGGQIPFTPRAKLVLELALSEALSLGHNYIGTEHVLLGLARENQGVAARTLLEFDADAERIRNEVVRVLSGPGRLQQRPLPEPIFWGERPGEPGLTDEWLNELGDAGWELIAAVETEHERRLVFKRRNV